jgi:hypothetical protein
VVIEVDSEAKIMMMKIINQEECIKVAQEVPLEVNLEREANIEVAPEKKAN